MRRTELRGLPNEVLALILEDISHSDLAALNQTCRKVYEKTVAKLYACMSFDVIRASDLRGRLHPVAMAVRTVSENASLAKLVQEISICTQPHELLFPEDIESEWLVALPAAQYGDAETFITSCRSMIITRFPEDKVTAWLAGLSSLQAVVACLILQCLEINTLRIGARIMAHLDPLLALAVSNHAALETVELNMDLTSCVDVHIIKRMPYSSLNAVLSLPAILELTAVIPELDLPKTFDMSNLQSLILNNTSLSEEELGTILKATPKLEHLAFHSVCDLESSRPKRDSTQTLECHLLQKSLNQVQASLKELVLSVTYFSYGADMFGIGLHGYTGSLSLRHFSKLKTLTAPYLMLLGRSPSNPTQLCDAIPSQLQSLTLTDDLNYMEEWEWTHSDLLLQVQDAAKKIDGSMSLHLRNSWWDDAGATTLKTMFESEDAPCRVLDTECEADKHDIPTFTTDARISTPRIRERFTRHQDKQRQKAFLNELYTRRMALLHAIEAEA